MTKEEFQKEVREIINKEREYIIDSILDNMHEEVYIRPATKCFKKIDSLYDKIVPNIIKGENNNLITSLYTLSGNFMTTSSTYKGSPAYVDRIEEENQECGKCLDDSFMFQKIYCGYKNDKKVVQVSHLSVSMITFQEN